MKPPTTRAPRVSGGSARKDKPSPPTSAAPSAADATAAQPLRPRRMLFVVLMVVFALWVAALVVMYVTTVHRGTGSTEDRPTAAPPAAPS